MNFQVGGVRSPVCHLEAGVVRFHRGGTEVIWTVVSCTTKVDEDGGPCSLLLLAIHVSAKFYSSTSVAFGECRRHVEAQC